MSKIVVSSMVSVDGIHRRPGGDVMAMPMDLAFADHNAERAREARSFLRLLDVRRWDDSDNVALRHAIAPA